MPLLPIALAAALAAGPDAPDCAKDPKNLLAKLDCGFASGIQGWEADSMGGPAKIAHEPKEGDPSPGALKGVGSSQGSLQAKGPCLPARPNTSYRYGARFRLVSGETYVCGPQIFHYRDAACQDSMGPLSAMSDLVEKTWQAFDPGRRPEAGKDQGVATTTGETKAIQLRFACSGQPDFVVLFDDVFVTEK
jgi:hypothetical protein